MPTTKLKPRHTDLLAVLLLLAGGLASGLTPVQAATDPAVQADRLEARIATVRSLLDASARLFADRGPGLQDTVEALIKGARADQEAGRTALAAQRVDDAYRLVRTAIVAATPNGTASERREPQAVGRNEAYAARARGVQALSDALQGMQANEAMPGDEEVAQRVADLSAAAEREHAGGNLAEANAHMDEALGLLKQAIVRHRSGHTLVRELTFGSAEEEYDYELDRHRTHQLLVKLVLGGPGDESGIDEAQATALEDADRLRNRAFQEANTGRFDEAVRTLEEASAILVRLLRASGLPIPGAGG